MKKGRLVILALIIAIIIFAFAIFAPEEQTNRMEIPFSFEILKLSSAGDYGYVVYSANGSGTANLLALNSVPSKKIYVLENQIGLGVDSLPDFIIDLESLENYGLKVTPISSVNSVPEDSLLIVPQGAMPDSVLSLLDRNLTILYIGKTNALMSDGIVSQEWYEPLNQTKKQKIVLYNTTLDELYSKNTTDLKQDILLNKWALVSNLSFDFSNETNTKTILLYDAQYLRVIYPTEEAYEVKDAIVQKPLKTIDLSPVFPNEEQSIYLSFEDSKGVPTLRISKNAKKVSEEKLGTIGQNVFYESLSFDSSGDYILIVEDLGGETASGVFHVYDLKIEQTNSEDIFYHFSVTLDGVPVKDEAALVYLLGSNSSMLLTVSNGELTVPAKLKQGQDTLVVEIFGQQKQVSIERSHTTIFDVYIYFGPWGLLLIAAIYVVILFTRKQPYKIKFDTVVKMSSGELKVPYKKIKQLVPKAIDEFGNSKCINPREFSIALRKYITDGFDVMDGNSESILKRFEKHGYLESYRSYYKIKGKEDVKKTVIDRLIREKLIEQGIQFRYSKGIFTTKESHIVFGIFPKKYRGKLILIFERRALIPRYLDSLGEKEKAKTALRIRNGSLLLLSVDELADYL